MTPVELIMKIWGIDKDCQDEVEKILKTTAPEHLGLSLANSSACSGEAFQKANDAWMATYLPEIRFE